MAIKRPDRYKHNNPAYPIVHSEDVKGGRLTVATKTDLSTLPMTKLEPFVSVCFVQDEGVDYRYKSGTWTAITSGCGFQPTWYNIVADTTTDLPAMAKDQVRIIRIIGKNGEMNPDGFATLGGVTGIRVSNYTMLICMEDSDGGTFGDVGYKYALVGNSTENKEIISVPNYGSLPTAPNIVIDAIYLTVDSGNLYIWDEDANNWFQLGSVVEGTLINEFTFEDTNNNPVIPDGTHLYKDTGSGIYYKWNGQKYEPFENQGGGGGGISWKNPTDTAIGFWDDVIGKIVDSHLSQHVGGVLNKGSYIAKTKKGNIAGDVQLEGAENFIYTMTANVNFKFDNLTLANDESAVITIQLTGSFAFSFPVGVVAQPYNDTYDGGKTNYLTVVITETVAGAIKGYYSLITE